MDRKHRTLFRVALAVGMAWLVFSIARDQFTAERRFYAKLDGEMWKLHLPGVERVRLSPHKRARYQALLRSRDPASRWQAAADLARWQDRDSVGRLVAAMRDDTGTLRTCVMAQSLGAIGDSRAVPALLEAIHHPRNLDLRVCATHALAEINDARAVAPLIAKAENVRLREDDRVAAIRALGDLARPEAAPVLRRIAAGDSNERYRMIATAALRQIDLMQASDPVPALTEALNSPAPWIQRSWIIQTLGEHWDSRSAVALNRFILRTDAWSADRIQAAALLLHRGAVEEEVTPALASADVKEGRWLARYIQIRETDRHHVDAFARSDLTERLILSALSP